MRKDAERIENHGLVKPLRPAEGFYLLDLNWIDEVLVLAQLAVIGILSAIVFIIHRLTDLLYLGRRAPRWPP